MTTINDLDLYTMAPTELEAHDTVAPYLYDFSIQEVLRDLAQICDWQERRYNEILHTEPAGYADRDSDYRYISKRLRPELERHVVRVLGNGNRAR